MRLLASAVLVSALVLGIGASASAQTLRYAPHTHHYGRYSPLSPDVLTMGAQGISPGTTNRYFSDTVLPSYPLGNAFDAARGGWENLPCQIDVYGCFGGYY